eukprot:4018647-Alexandrium_andersonii.AAC.1
MQWHVTLCCRLLTCIRPCAEWPRNGAQKKKWGRSDFGRVPGGGSYVNKTPLLYTTTSRL